ncbi:MAG: hypothetical protein ACPIOQ_32230 [Promethearchaeia archaeon]
MQGLLGLTHMKDCLLDDSYSGKMYPPMVVKEIVKGSPVWDLQRPTFCRLIIRDLPPLPREQGTVTGRLQHILTDCSSRKPRHQGIRFAGKLLACRNRCQNGWWLLRKGWRTHMQLLQTPVRDWGTDLDMTGLVDYKARGSHRC